MIDFTGTDIGITRELFIGMSSLGGRQAEDGVFNSGAVGACHIVHDACSRRLVGRARNVIMGGLIARQGQDDIVARAAGIADLLVIEGKLVVDVGECAGDGIRSVIVDDDVAVVVVGGHVVIWQADNAQITAQRNRAVDIELVSGGAVDFDQQG